MFLNSKSDIKSKLLQLAMDVIVRRTLPSGSIGQKKCNGSLFTYSQKTHVKEIINIFSSHKRNEYLI